MKLLVIGCGSSGLGVGLAAARRGWAVEILEAGDIGGGTSTISTKLIHGGVRYLESAIKRLSWADWHLVREALRERAWMLASAPTVCHPLSLVLPVSNVWERVYYGVGLWLYDKLSYPHRLASIEWLDKVTLKERFSSINDEVIGGWRYWDGQFVDRRYAVYLALFLRQRYQVQIYTHRRVVGIKNQGRQVVVQSTNRAGQVMEHVGDYVVNAAGPWADEIRRLVLPKAPARLRWSRGSHLVLAPGQIVASEGLLVPRTRDGRVLFILPWLEGTWLVGTTDEEVLALTWPCVVPEEDVSYLLGYLERYFGLRAPQIAARFCGYRPLVQQGQVATAKLARSHVVEVWPAQRMVSVLGGKWTTFRRMGEEAVEALARLAGLPLSSGEVISQIEPDWAQLVRYKVLEPDRILEGEPYTWGEVRFWYELGWAQEPADLVEGRWLLHLIDEKRAWRLRQALSSGWARLTKAAP